ncbi:unnamed protein product [Prorocentrum cordatum]|uniref:Coatomer subunit delta n=1 Tax=Prorocentrum cordatum TaxID=2364126 RepID=A0ABN9VH17_9DINO|nr:unnamed protein product [Polarella glacialis]
MRLEAGAGPHRCAALRAATAADLVCNGASLALDLSGRRDEVQILSGCSFSIGNLVADSSTATFTRYSLALAVPEAQDVGAAVEVPWAACAPELPGGLSWPLRLRVDLAAARAAGGRVPEGLSCRR